MHYSDFNNIDLMTDTQRSDWAKLEMVNAHQEEIVNVNSQWLAAQAKKNSRTWQEMVADNDRDRKFWNIINNVLLALIIGGVIFAALFLLSPMANDFWHWRK